MKTLKCPSCGASIDVDIQGRDSVFCSYCGQQIQLDDEKREFTYNKNVNVTKTIHKRYTDDADVIRAKTEAGEDNETVEEEVAEEETAKERKVLKSPYMSEIVSLHADMPNGKMEEKKDIWFMLANMKVSVL